MLADQPRGMRPDRVEVAQGDRRELRLGAGEVVDHLLDEELGPPIGVGGAERRRLVDRVLLRHAVDRRRRGEHQPRDAVAPHRLQERHCAPEVDRVVVERQRHRLADRLQAGEVHDRVDPPPPRTARRAPRRRGRRRRRARAARRRSPRCARPAPGRRSRSRRGSPPGARPPAARRPHASRYSPRLRWPALSPCQTPLRPPRTLARAEARRKPQRAGSLPRDAHRRRPGPPRAGPGRCGARRRARARPRSGRRRDPRARI